MEASFASSTAGGNFASPLFMNNPQWHLNIRPGSTSDKAADSRTLKSNIRISIEGDRRMPLNGCIAWSKAGERLAECDSSIFKFGQTLMIHIESCKGTLCVLPVNIHMVWHALRAL